MVARYFEVFLRERREGGEGSTTTASKTQAEFNWTEKLRTALLTFLAVSLISEM